MSLLKRKSSSLDPVQKQRKFRQCQYFSLLDKCLQIPNDDKLILRKNIQQEQERLISMVETYRKQTPKDLQSLQIHLRKYIQKYKADYPKYPTLRLAKSPEQSYSMQKRNSFSFSINTSKVTVDLGSSVSQVKQSFHVPLRKQVFSPHVKQQKSVLRLNSQLSRQQERNYEDLIRKRKTQKLKISGHRVSVTIQNESHSASFYKDLEKTQHNKEKDNQQQNYAKRKQTLKANHYEPQMTESKSPQTDSLQIVNNSLQKADFLQTMQFRMKADDTQDKNETNLFNPKQICQFSLQKANLPSIMTDQSIFQTLIDQRIPTKNDNTDQFSSVKRILFSNTENLSSSKVSDQQNQLKSRENSRIRKPLEEINFENTFSSIKKLQEMKLGNLPIQSSRGLHKDSLGEKQKFNSGHKNSQDLILRELFNKNDNQSFADSQVRQQTKSNLDFESRMKKQKSFHKVESQYMNSQRKLSQLYSNRMHNENNRSLMNSFSKDKDQKEKRSSRMIFSHRMQEVISGRKHQNRDDKPSEHAVSSSYSFREKKKAATKLQFWARIQSTINQ